MPIIPDTAKQQTTTEALPMQQVDIMIKVFFIFLTQTKNNFYILIRQAFFFLFQGSFYFGQQGSI